VTTATVAPVRGSAPAQATFNPAAPMDAPPPRCIKPMPASPPPAAPPGAAPGCPPDPDGQPRLPRVALSFPEGRDAALNVELTRTPDEHARGLMYRRSMPEDRGMLFRMGERIEHTFWMRNTCISLDLMFIDDDGTIVGIVENAPTLTDAQQTVGCPSSWVLEVNAGWSRRHGVASGQRVAIPEEARR
jgi:uncharacterized membrane protein (UPF0127 family)